MSDSPSAFPLSWPLGKPRTPGNAQKFGKFRKEGFCLTVAVAADRLDGELDRLGAVYPLISSNVEVTLSGRPRAGQRNPADPGVCVYFRLKGKPYAMACDRYTTVADNLAAIAAHIDAVRAIERHGVATAAETLTVFEALPAPKRPHEILGVAPHADADEIRRAWRDRIAQGHPDQGGTHSAAAEINAARDEMIRMLSEARH